jgi:hypothetical protein
MLAYDAWSLKAENAIYWGFTSLIDFINCQDTAIMRGKEESFNNCTQSD